MIKNEKKFFIGIDLGWKDKRTTGICILTKNDCLKCEDVFGKNVLKALSPYLKNTEVIAIDAPLTKGRGKGAMRLYEKFLSTSIFRKEKVNPLPPALMPQFHQFAMELTKELEEKGFVLDLNLIEVFPTFIKKVCRSRFLSINCPCLVDELRSSSPSAFARLVDELRSSSPSAFARVTENQKSALICAKTALLHSQFKTRWLGYKDGFLFLPAMSFWRKAWRQKFSQAWESRPRLKYYRLITNIFKY